MIYLVYPSVVFAQEIFTYDLLTYFNVTHSGLKGEPYLFNKQLSTIKFSSDLQLNSWSKIHTLFIYNKTPLPIAPTFYFDEAYIDIKKPESSWGIVAGRKWLPFGAFKSDLIYKPFTKAMGQTNEDHLGVSFTQKELYTSAEFFKPHIPIKSTTALQYNFNTGLKKDSDSFSYEVGTSYLNSIAEAQLFQYNNGFGGFLDHTIQSQVPGISLFTNLKYKKYNLNTSFITAKNPFKKNELSFQHHGAQPASFSLQAGYEFSVKHIPSKFIAFYDESFEALGLLLPKKRAGIGLNIFPSKHIDTQFQLFNDYGYKKNTTAGGMNQTVNGDSSIRHTAAFQLVLKF
jgi:hypothetical protein